MSNSHNEYHRLHTAYVKLCLEANLAPRTLTSIKYTATIDALNALIKTKQAQVVELKAIKEAPLKKMIVKEPAVGDVWLFAKQAAFYISYVCHDWLFLYQPSSRTYFKIKKSMFSALMRLILTHTDMTISCKSIKGDVTSSILKDVQRITHEHLGNRPKDSDELFDVLPEAISADLFYINLNNNKHISTYGIHFIDTTQEVIRDI